MDAQTTYGALALLPAIVAIVLSIWKRQVIVALVLGIWIGATIINGYNPLVGLLETFSTYIVGSAIADSWNAGLLVFCLAIGGMIGVMSKLGGTKAIAEALASKAKDVRTTQLAAALMGIAIFFDDYANSMVVGNTMRPITDEQKISREKLSYIVDTTAAAVSSMAPVSTWIAMEIGLIAGALGSLNIEANSIIVFFQTLPFRFYSIFTLVLMFTLIMQKKDFGKMLDAEIRARKTGEVFAEGSTPLFVEDENLLPAKGVRGTVWDAAIPIITFILVTTVGLWYNGYEPGSSIRDAFGNADASVALTWAAFLSSIVALGIGLAKKRFSLDQGVTAWVDGLKSMIIAVIILALAFALKSVISEMQLAEWLIYVTQGSLSSSVLPTLTFLIAMFIAFATGTSWGTNSIVMPIVVPIAAAISGATDVVTPLMVTTIGAVLTGAVLGDHCSPISDTTILSSMASGSDHVDHVNTQLPYAAAAGAFAVVFGFIPAGLGISPWISLAAGTVAIIVFVKFVGKQVDENGNIVS
ncbi:Na+/H+ antiporter NhaC family protein [Methanosarcina sp. KYL-1]|uniref:Na+/H+ antiporter NhaC family protein n=1 Tax=Methanosarcina sp. KYL-1 TaxID=2602068 RepID=UPI0021009168|nr:Na+/H+ antiporter NhaC family protein [Methanosarcina sp. KYL-1]MCQ1536538.1 Na+/H+ antiporter NhaC family protein [Methanosarcina sp. KYL-1]